jgi:DNA-binding NarL/FixJ family response regulator
MGTKCIRQADVFRSPSSYRESEYSHRYPEKALMTAPLLNYAPLATELVTGNHHRESDLNVLIADDRRSRSYHIWASLSSLRDVSAITTGESIEEVLGLALRQAPEVSLVSGTFGSGEGLSLAHRLKDRAAPPSVLIYADAVDPVLAGAAVVAAADGVFAWEADAGGLGELIDRVLHGERVFPRLLPDPFVELASHVAGRDRRIVAMLLAGAHPDSIAHLCGISARELTLRRHAIVRRLDAAYACASIPQPDVEPPSPGRDDTLPAAPRSVIFG